MLAAPIKLPTRKPAARNHQRNKLRFTEKGTCPCLRATYNVAQRRACVAGDSGEAVIAEAKTADRGYLRRRSFLLLRFGPRERDSEPPRADLRQISCACRANVAGQRGFKLRISRARSCSASPQAVLPAKRSVPANSQTPSNHCSESPKPGFPNQSAPNRPSPTFSLHCLLISSQTPPGPSPRRL